MISYRIFSQKNLVLIFNSNFSLTKNLIPEFDQVSQCQCGALMWCSPAVNVWTPNDLHLRSAHTVSICTSQVQTICLLWICLDGNSLQLLYIMLTFISLHQSIRNCSSIRRSHPRSLLSTSTRPLPDKQVIFLVPSSPSFNSSVCPTTALNSHLLFTSTSQYILPTISRSPFLVLFISSSET